MAEAVGLASSVIAVAQLTWETCKVLNDTIKGFQNAPEKLKNLRSDLSTLLQLLASLRGYLVQAAAAGHTSIPDGLKPALQGCQKLCDEFLRRINELTSHSTPVYISKRDRVRFHFNDTEITHLKDRLVQYKLTFDIALNVASLRTTSQNKQMTENLDVKFVTSLGRLTGKIESLEVVMQGISTSQIGNVADRDQYDHNVLRAVAAFEQYERGMKECMRIHTPALEEKRQSDGATVKWIRALDDAQQSCGNLGNVDSGDPVTCVKQAEASGQTRQYFGDISGDIAVELSDEKFPSC
ncbi:hypothetical protein VM1G_06957 [Cytospora mali]|uniref:Azaphilone pigments biosynthesis cluster protein L N-terminal domain-containing protein n=1 Tax=Cytospora mali TaxID=578113 RepID=A0A194W4E6_CYTMA|nr:hypothetical protein VM1G_06957 [Valsa mali]